MTYYQNQYNSVNLMIWETAEGFRNQNNEIKFYCDSKINIQIGDVIIGNYNADFFSSYEIEEIKEVRDGAMSNQLYITAKVVWKNRGIGVLKGENLDFVSITLQKLIK